MRKWVLYLDLIMLLTCAALLVIDIQIKNEIVKQAKTLERAISEGQGTTEQPDLPGDLPGVLLRDSDPGNAEVPGEADGDDSAKETAVEAKPVRRAGNSRTRVSRPGEPVGA